MATNHPRLSWVTRLALIELAERHGRDEQAELEELVRRAAIAELGGYQAERQAVTLCNK